MKQKIIKLNEQGYTLIELLAVIVIMVAVGIIVAAILVSSLRGSDKTNVLDEVRQNGNLAMAQMAKMVEFASGFKGVSTDGITYVTDCTTPFVPTPSPSPAPTQYRYLKITSFDGNDTVFSCGTLNAQALSSNSASLINANSVAVSSCYFYCSQSSIIDAPVININFTLSDEGDQTAVEKKASVPFETSVIMRNLR